LKTIKHILSRYSAFLWAVLKPFGSWGIFLIAALDGSIVGLPVDVVVAGYVYQNPARLLLYVLMASAGSAFGSIIIYVIGYKGGEELLRKRIPAERFEKIHGTFEKHPFWSLMFPAMLPPPTPFKLFVLAAAASEMGFWKFLLAIFSGRVVRFLILALLILKFGPGFVHALGEMFRAHLYWVWIILAVGLTAAVLMAKRRSGRSRPTPVKNSDS
jgi:membrane protein YqaA with SNARE-associated domain